MQLQSHRSSVFDQWLAGARQVEDCIIGRHHAHMIPRGLTGERKILVKTPHSMNKSTK
jgi:hypothetical protein